jgi:hypothetical protein
MDAIGPRLEKPVSGVTGVRAYRYEALSGGSLVAGADDLDALVRRVERGWDPGAGEDVVVWDAYQVEAVLLHRQGQAPTVLRVPRAAEAEGVQSCGEASTPGPGRS